MLSRENVLVVNKPRLGWFVTEEPNIGEVPCTLTDTGSRIELTFQWLGLYSVFERWLGGDGTQWGDDPDRTRHRYSVPDVLWFLDNSGVVTLVGCINLGYSIGSTGGVGRIGVRRAVFGGRSGIDYRRIHGLRSEIPGLSQWMNLRSLNFERALDENTGRLRSLHLRLESPEPVPLSRELNLTVRPSFHFNPSAYGDTSEVNELVYVETTTKRLKDWASHEASHNSIRELVSLAAWKQFSVSRVLVQRHDDPERVLSGEAIGPRWALMSTRSRRDWTSPSGRIEFLFTFPDIGSAGVRRWMSLRRVFQRGIPPVLDTLGQTETALEIQVAQAGIGMDGIGYQLALDQGVPPAQANHENHEARLHRVAADLRVDPPFNVPEWAKESARAYNAVKHANRVIPSHLDLVETRRKHHLIFRYWVAGRVGTTRRKLTDYLEYDHMRHPYTVSSE